MGMDHRLADLSAPSPRTRVPSATPDIWHPILNPVPNPKSRVPNPVLTPDTQHLKPSLSHFLSITFPDIVDKWFIFINIPGSSEVSFLSCLFSYTFQVLPSF